ncbi:MAG: ABC transporter permease [Candidatus Pacebacteria bacterium]|nr:ABC transporter permease [Candidatus Paceibacterota bacterium]
MKIRDLVTLSLRGFKTNTSRTVLTVLGLGVGIGAVLFLVSLGYGLQNVILNRITTADALLTLDVSSVSDLIKLDDESLKTISTYPGVTETSPVLSLSGQTSFGLETTETVSLVVDKPFFRLSGINLDAGQEFSSAEASEVVISSATAQIFGFSNPDEMIGERVVLSLYLFNNENSEIEIITPETDYKVVGIINDENTSFIYVPINTLRSIELPIYSNLKVKVENSEQLNPVRDFIVKQGLLVSSISDTIDQTKKIFGIIQIVLGVFGLIALVVSAIGMFNTMTIALLERTKEIGIMRAIGVSNGDISKLFLMESIIMGFLGGISGVLIGYVGGKIFNIVVNILARNFGGQVQDLFYSPAWFVVFILIFSGVTGFLTGIYPARRAARLNPLDALRYK